MSSWQVEISGPYTMLVVRRRSPIAQKQDLARDDKGRIIWFTSRAEAQVHADRLNEQERAKS